MYEILILFIITIIIIVYVAKKMGAYRYSITREIEVEMKIMNTLKARGPSTVEEIARETGIGLEEVNRSLSRLIVEGLVKILYDKDIKYKLASEMD